MSNENLNSLQSGAIDPEHGVIAAESAKLDQRQAALVELRAAMEKRDNAAAESSRFADEEAHLEEEVQAATQEKAATLAEAQVQLAVFESARAHLEHLQAPPASALLEGARRNLNAAKTASDTAAREARVAADVLIRLEERLATVRKRRGEMRRQQAVDHEAFEKEARTLRIFTQEALQEAFEELAKARVNLNRRVNES